MKPYPHANISYDERVFNYRLSRARRVVQNVLSTRFQILQRPIKLHVDKVDTVVLACCALHNYLRKTDPSYDSDIINHPQDTNDGIVNLGVRSSNTQLTRLETLCERDSSNSGRLVRNIYKNYFNTVGAVPFQERMLNDV